MYLQWMTSIIVRLSLEDKCEQIISLVLFFTPLILFFGSDLKIIEIQKIQKNVNKL